MISSLPLRNKQIVRDCSNNLLLILSEFKRTNKILFPRSENRSFLIRLTSLCIKNLNFAGIPGNRRFHETREFSRWQKSNRLCLRYKNFHGQMYSNPVSILKREFQKTKKYSFFYLEVDRSSPSEVFLREGVKKICSKFTGEHPCRSAISIK